MWSICVRYIQQREEALEALNDGYLKIFQHIATYDPARSALITWMSRIMIHTAIDCLRRKKSWHYIPVEETIVEEEIYSDDLPDRYSAEELLFYIHQLPEQTKLVFNLYTIEGYSHEEVAGFLGISASTSRWHVTEARKRLQKMIHNHGR
jgi:RNA polymerase sigma-70 factor (ECF subfamily)